MKACIWLSVDVVPLVPVLAVPLEAGGGGGGGMSVERLLPPLVPLDAVSDCSTVSSAPIRLEAEVSPLVDAAAVVPEADVSVSEETSDVLPDVPVALVLGGGPGGGPGGGAGGDASVADEPSVPVLSVSLVLLVVLESCVRNAINADDVVLPALSMEELEVVLAALVVPDAEVVSLLASRRLFSSWAAILLCDPETDSDMLNPFFLVLSWEFAPQKLK